MARRGKVDRMPQQQDEESQAQQPPCKEDGTSLARQNLTYWHGRT